MHTAANSGQRTHPMEYGLLPMKLVTAVPPDTSVAPRNPGRV